MLSAVQHERAPRCISQFRRSPENFTVERKPTAGCNQQRDPVSAAVRMSQQQCLQITGAAAAASSIAPPHHPL